ncbi:MAG: hypothetical protein FIA92_16690 [Chloroflexi bacterium]|nr:hypothetical protein [Chloroflexota bacterium]
MNNRRLSPDQSPAPPAVQRLAAALQLLATRMRAAATVRRTSPPGSERHRRADEEVAYLNELYVRLQRRMEIPSEIWRLDGGHSRGRRRPAQPRS